MTEGTKREQWMLRLGPVYPALLAFRLLSSLPLARGLVPADEDYSLVGPLLPAVGCALGGLLAVLATLLLASPLVAAIGAALLVAVAFFVSGGFSERALADALGRWSFAAGQPSSGFLLALVLIRLIVLAGTDVEAWAAALIAVALAPRIFLVAVSVLDPEPTDTRALVARASRNYLLGGLAAAALIAVLMGGFIVLWAFVIGGGAAFVARKRGHLDWAACAICELLVFVLMAAAHPASASPFIAP